MKLLLIAALILLAKCLPWPLAFPVLFAATFILFRWVGLYGESHCRK